MTSDPPKRYLIISEVLLVTALFAAFVAITIRVRETNQASLPAPYEWVGTLAEMYGWKWELGVTLLSTCLVGAVLFSIRECLPRNLKERVFWFRSFQNGSDAPNETSILKPVYAWRSIRHLCLLAAADVFFFIIESHATVDRSDRRPVVTWSGPLVDLLFPMTVLGVCFSLVGAVGVWKAIDRSPYFFDFWEWVCAGLVFSAFLNCIMITMLALSLVED